MPQESYFTYAGQDDSPVDHDISFRPGLGADGSDTYTPRTLIYDLKGAFGTLRRENALYELQQQENPARDGPWSGSTASLQLPPIAPSPYQRALDQSLTPPQLTTDTVRFWSDYNHLFYHPRSIIQLNEYEINSSLMPFEKWTTGEELFTNLDREHDLLDRDLRPLLEECDQLQALQIFSSTDDAWGGFTVRYLEALNDQLGKGCRWVFGLKDDKPVARERMLLQTANFAQSLSMLDSIASLHVPISSVPASLTRYLALQASSPWHTSALQALAIESLTLPTRLRTSEHGISTFDELEATLNDNGHRRVAGCALSVEDPSHLVQTAQSGGYDTRMTNGNSGDHHAEEVKLDIDTFPSLGHLSNVNGNRLGRRTHVFSKTEILRGQWPSTDDTEASWADLRDRFAEGPRTLCSQSTLLFPLLTSYPHIFRFEDRPDYLAVKATLSTSTAIADSIRDLERASRRMIGIEDREALCDGLVGIAEEYDEGWSGGEDSADED